MSAPGFDSTVLARDNDGEEHRIEVSCHMLHAGLVVVADDAATRIMSVPAALRLASELVRVAMAHRRPKKLPSACAAVWASIPSESGDSVPSESGEIIPFESEDRYDPAES